MVLEMSESALIHPPAETLELSAVLHALSDPVRLTIVRELASREACNCGSFGVPVAKSTLSHHLRVHLQLERAAAAARGRSTRTAA